MKNSIEEYIGKFVRIIIGKHEGEYAYVESVHDWAGGSIGVISAKENGDRFECMLSPYRVMLCETEEEISLARECALNFYKHDIASKIAYINACDDAAEKERVAVIARDRIIKMSNIENIVL